MNRELNFYKTSQTLNTITINEIVEDDEKVKAALWLLEMKSLTKVRQKAITKKRCSMQFGHLKRHLIIPFYERFSLTTHIKIKY